MLTDLRFYRQYSITESILAGFVYSAENIITRNAHHFYLSAKPAIPQPSRKIEVPKKNTRQTRELAINNITNLGKSRISEVLWHYISSCE